jgi:endonuclease III
MLYDNYRFVCEDFDACKGEYFAMRNQINARWDELLQRFSEGLKEYISSCGIPKKKAVEIHRSMMNQMPTRKAWYHSFQFWLEVREYLVQPGSLPGMDEKWMKRTENLVKSLISEQVSNLFDRSAAILQNLSSLPVSVDYLMSLGENPNQTTLETA